MVEVLGTRLLALQGGCAVKHFPLIPQGICLHISLEESGGRGCYPGLFPIPNFSFLWTFLFKITHFGMSRCIFKLIFKAYFNAHDDDGLRRKMTC